MNWNESFQSWATKNINNKSINIFLIYFKRPVIFLHKVGLQSLREPRWGVIYILDRSASGCGKVWKTLSAGWVINQMYAIVSCILNDFNYCFDSLAIRLRSEDLKTPYPRNRTTRITGLACMLSFLSTDDEQEDLKESQEDQTSG